jgi:hypothetical protein
MPRTGAVFTGITAAMFLGMAGCSSETGPDPSPGSATVTASADLRAVSERWKGLSGPEQNAVCEHTLQTEGPDYRGMLHALMETGMGQPDAAEMLPYAVNECV